MSAEPAFFGVSTEWPQNILPAISVIYSQCDPQGIEHYSICIGEMISFSAETCRREAIAGAKDTNNPKRIPSTEKKERVVTDQ